MRTLKGRASGLALVLALGTLLGATPASAASGVGVVELSDDGVNFSGSYPGVVFDDIARLTPGDSQSETMYLRNAGTVAGYLRVTLRDVRYSDQHFGNALTVTTSTPSSTGSAKAVSSAKPCQVTHEGTLVAPGEVVPIIATMELGNLNGTDGQGATASVAMRFALSDSTPGKLPATNCGNSGATVPITPNNPGASGALGAPGANGATGSSLSPASTVFVLVPNLGSNAVHGITGLPGEGTRPGSLPEFHSTFSLDPNTWRLYQEYLVLILVLATIIGAGISWLVGRRSRRDAEGA